MGLKGKNTKLRIFIFILPFILMAVFYYFLFYTEYNTFYRVMRKENQPVELLTFLFLLVSAILGFVFSYKLFRAGNRLFSLFYFIFAFGLFFVSMEEISWGQWIFKFSTPQYFRGINRQTEFNVHNIESINLFFEITRVLFGLGGLVSIALAKFRGFKFLSSPLALSSWFLIILIFASLDLFNRFDPYYGAEYKGSLLWFTSMFTEFLELLISFSAFLFILYNYRKYNTGAS